LVTSVSVFEHIAPENGGEEPAARSWARCGAGRNRFADGAVLADVLRRISCRDSLRTTSTDGTNFLQRFYDMNLLKRNLVAASAYAWSGVILSKSDSSRVIRTRAWLVISSEPAAETGIRATLSLLARVFLSKPKELEKCKKPYIACLVLRNLEFTS
jgi:hypothetical protein